MPILATKLYLPPPRPNAVLRPHLLDLLNDGLAANHRLTLISAPAGFGKTTLVSEWVARSGRPAAWLSLDEADSDSTRFLTYLIAALQTIVPQVGIGLAAALSSPQPPSTRAVLTALLNELTTLPDPFTLVLDDYHLLDSKPIDEALAFLLDHQPPQMHLVIATREDPNLPLARYRARGQLTELRAADLRFTAAEAAVFLNELMGLNLSAQDIDTLETRTEGWIAGLQLAALSLQGHQDAAGFIQSFTGSHRFVLDYLVEEVLQHQSEPIRSFLLQTAILDRFCASLCNAVTRREDGKETLEVLDRSNLLLFPLDDHRQWYRYHHLFAEVLQAHLTEAEPDRVSTLHRRASKWFEQNGLPLDAIRHALAAGDSERAADLIELAVPAIQKSRQVATITVLGWLKALPDELIRFRPVLSVHYAFALMGGGELEAVEARLRDAERWLDTTADTAEMVVLDQEAFSRLPVSIAVYRAALAQALGDVPGTVKSARRALDLLPDDDQLWRGAATALLGLAYWASGDLEAARRTYADGMARVRLAGNITNAISSTIALADILIAQGRLREATSTYEQSLRLATEQGGPALRGTADLYVGMSELHREHNDLNAATQHLQKSDEFGERAGLPQNRSRWCVAMARIREALGDLDGALDLLQEAERLCVRDFSPNVRPVAALKARVWLAQGWLDQALAWAQERGLSVEDALDYLREFEHITLARVLLARAQSDHAPDSISAAQGLLERLLKAAEKGGRKGSVIEILLLQALARHAQGDLPAALKPLQQALTLAEPEGYVRLFLDEGPGMMELLREASARRIMPDYTGKLLAAFEGEQQRIPGESPLTTPLVSQPLIEPLSQRELEVLRLLAQGLSNREISERLCVALCTVKGHNQNIFAKLQAQRRTEAVARARELGLL